MRILFCNKYNFSFSGTEVYLLELMDLLRSQGHEVALFSMADPQGLVSAPVEHLAPFIEFKGEHSWWEKAQLAGHAIYSTGVRRKIRMLIAEFRPDIAHVRNIYHHLSPSILWELHAHEIPVLYHINDFKLICPAYNLVARGQICEQCHGGEFWHVIRNRCCLGQPGAAAVLAVEAYVHKWLRTYETCVSRIVAPSHFARRKLVENGWEEDRVEVLYHFQRVPQGEPSAVAEDAPIMYFGRLSPEKGLVSLLQAMSNMPSVPLLIAGEGPQKEELQQIARSLGLSQVKFLGHLQREELDRLLSASRFTVLPSLAYETLGKSILESYAWGRPVVASDLGSRRELIVPGKTGLLYPAGNAERLAEAISLLWEHPLLTQEMGRAGRELVRSRHSPNLHYRSLLRIYENLLETKPAAISATTRPDPRLRVAFVGGRGVIGKYSGIESYYEEVGSRLVKMGHAVTAYCRSYFTPPISSHNGMRIVRLPCLRTKHLETLSHTILSAIHAALGPYDLVHFHTLGPALFSFLPRLFGKKTIVTVQGLDWRRKKWGRFARWVLRLGERAAIRLPNSTVVVSCTLRDYYRSRYGTEPIFVPNGTRVREPPATKHLVNRGLESRRYVLFLGRFSPEKNCDLLIRAFKQVEGDMKLVLAGGSSYSDPYVAELRKQQSDQIRLLDWISGEALEELLTNSALFVMPSDLEGLSLAVLEAMGAGVCVLVSDVPENCELVDGIGFTFRHGDEQDLVRMLRLLVADDEMRDRAGRASQQRIREKYLWSDIARQIEREYFRVMEWHGRADSQAPKLSKVA
jgi:glycosyltransferase involved in cell wall biosynthesis